MHLGSSTGYRKLDVECCSLCDVAALMSLETLNRIFASNSWLLLHDQASSVPALLGSSCLLQGMLLGNKIVLAIDSLAPSNLAFL